MVSYVVLQGISILLGSLVSEGCKFFGFLVLNNLISPINDVLVLCFQRIVIALYSWMLSGKIFVKLNRTINAESVPFGLRNTNSY